MIKRYISFSLLAFSIILCGGGCAVASTPIGFGGIVTTANMPITATANKVGSKTGSATCSNVLGIVAFGDCSISSIAQNNGIATISTVDSKIFSILTFYSSMTVTVTGE